MADLRNFELMAKTWRYCAYCDPKGENPIQCLPGLCSCSHELIVVTPQTGTTYATKQYEGSRERYSKPVALVTGNAAFGPLISRLFVPNFERVRSPLIEEALPVPDTDIPF
jgi:hypothetical protein